MDVVLGLVDRVAVMHHGELLACRRPERVMANETVQSAYLGGGGHERPTGAGMRAERAGACQRRRIAGQEVVDDVSFEVPASGVTAVLGRNGVGKTSTLQAILGLIDAVGRGAARRRPDGRRAHPPHRPARRRLRAGGPRGVRGPDRRREPAARPERDGRPRSAASWSTPCSRTWSSGPASARARSRAASSRWSPWPGRCSTTNRILLVDEPTKGLAPRIVTEVAEALANAALTVPVLLVEQNLQVVERLAERVVVIDAGRVVRTPGRRGAARRRRLTSGCWACRRLTPESARLQPATTTSERSAAR